MTVSVIIPSLYEIDHEYLRLCVESLRATTDYHIIVVTNGSKVQPKLPFLCTHLHTSQQGQCNAVNIGAQVAEGEYLMVSNSDMYYAPGWNKNLHLADYNVFSPNLVEPENNHGSAAPFLKLDAGFTLEEFDKQKVDAFVAAHDDNFSELGFNLPFFIKADLWRHLGGYDVAYDPWGSNSDTDLQTRINLAGITPRRMKDVLVYHFSNKTPTFSPENDAFRMFNFDYFKDKFGFDRDELGSDVWYNKDMLPTGTDDCADCVDESRIKYRQEKYNA